VSESHFENKDTLSVEDCWNLVKKEVIIRAEHIELSRPMRVASSIEYNHAINLIIKSKSPIIIATDGGHTSANNLAVNFRKHKTTAAMVVCLLDIKEHESIESREWENRPTIPILARNMILPKNYGAETSDIGHGEAVAFCMQEEIFDPAIPRCVVMDSSAVRNRILEIRDFEELTDRHYIQEMMNGLGKSVLSRMENAIHRWSRINLEEEVDNPFHRELRIRNKRFIDVARNWIGHTEKSDSDASNSKTEKKWSAEYFDDNIHRCIIKVDSHQLEESKGVSQASTPRYAKIIPNLALTNVNHYADKAAEEAMICNLADIEGFPEETSYNLLLPHSNLKFFITWDKKAIDKNTIGFIRRKLELERLKRWKEKEVQGLLPRIIEFSSADPEEINNSRGWKRALSGKSNTHTRCMYLNSAIRIGWIMEDKCIGMEDTKDTKVAVEESFLNTSYVNQKRSQFIIM